MKQVGHILSDLVERELIDDAQHIARRFDVTVEEMVGRRRLGGIPAARHAMWAELHSRGHWSYSRIAELFGVDHTTVIDGLRSHARREEKNASASEKVIALSHEHAVE